MFAIVDIDGHQHKVQQGDRVVVNRITEKTGHQVTLDKVLLVSDGKKTRVGTPFVKGVTVIGKVADHLRAKKVLVFKKKRRKGYQKLNGHRQDMTQLVIEDIKAGKGTTKAASGKKSVSKSGSKMAASKPKKSTTKKKPASGKKKSA